LQYKAYSKDKNLAEAEEKAGKEKRGLWADKSPEPPWEFRKKERGRQKESGWCQ
jgi:endonuclease YncB( thermonuclease family)